MTYKFYPDSDLNCFRILQNYYESFDEIGYYTLDDGILEFNGKFCYLADGTLAWCEFKSLEDLTQFILRFS